MNLPTPMTELDAPPASRARANLLKRLADVVCLPLSRINAFERAMTADLLADMLREAEPAERKRVAQRISGLAEIPATLARLLLRLIPLSAGRITCDEQDITAAITPECPRWPKRFVVSVDGFPAKLGQQLDCGTFD